jgi:hypothetical protein
LFEQAKIQQERIRELIPDFLSVEYQLGPEPSQFPSVQEWAAARRRAFDVSDKIADLWLSTLSVDDGSWFTLLVHPDAWPELRPIIAEEPFERLMSKSFAAVKSLSPFSVIPIQIHHIRSLDCADVLQLCNCVVEIVRKHGIRFVRNHPLIDHMLVSSQFPEITSSAAHELLRMTKGLRLPSFWSQLITRICSTAEGVDVRQLIDFWSHYDRRFAHFPPNLLKSLDTAFEKLVSCPLEFIEYKGLIEMAEPRAFEMTQV